MVNTNKALVAAKTIERANCQTQNAKQRAERYSLDIYNLALYIWELEQKVDVECRGVSIWSNSDPRNSIGNDTETEIIITIKYNKHLGDTFVRVGQIYTDENESIVWFYSGGIPRLETEDVWPKNWYWALSPIKHKED
jgi:hypothetical protein